MIENPDYLAVVYEIQEGDDWTSEEVWRRVMPALDDFCSLKFIQGECRKAQQLPAYENTFRQLYLNQWTEQAKRWISVYLWKQCGAYFPASEQYGIPCYGGYDHGVTGDMACLALAWPTDRGIRTFVHGWVPRDGKWRDEPRNRDRYLQWERDGYLTFTDGNAIDEDAIEADIARYNEKCPILSLFADRAYANRLLTRLANNHDLSVKGIPQGPVTLNEACVKLEEMLLNGQVEHGSNPILDWNVANASLVRTSTGLCHLDKSSSTERIDGLAALLNALTAMIADPEHRGPSIYETRPIFCV